MGPDGTIASVSRDQILRRERGQEKNTCAVQLATSRIGNLTRLTHILLQVNNTYTYKIDPTRLILEKPTKIAHEVLFESVNVPLAPVAQMYLVTLSHVGT